MIELPGRLIVQVHSAFAAYTPLVMTPEGSADRAPPEHGAPLSPPLEAPPVGVGGSVAGKGTAAGAPVADGGEPAEGPAGKAALVEVL